MNWKYFRLVTILLLLSSLPIALMIAKAQEDPTEEATAEAAMTEEEALLERGHYLIYIAGCISCHTPAKEEYADFAALSVDQAINVSLFALDTLDVENRQLAGGRVFDLGPIGVIMSRNLTPDVETGLGAWTDEEIEAAIRIGVSRDGYRLFPIMPYRNYYSLSEYDMDAIIAYLRSLPAVVNEVPRIGPSGEGIAPELILSDDVLATAPPDSSDPVALGAYLVNTVMSCADCHTPLDETTGEPLFDQWLAGGQPWEGPWGIVYGGNITPHEETGIGTWTDEEIARAVREGVRIDGRQLILMPWQDYAVTTDEDIAAVVAYLRSIPAIDNEAPAPSIEDAFMVYEEE
jgi:mono/diheme cytochrome c family protein